MANPQNLKPFKPGDPRINRKGRPKSFDMARELAQIIGGEPLIGEGGKYIINRNNQIVTRFEAIFRDLSGSRDVRKQELFLYYAIGKPRDELEISGPVRLYVEYEDRKEPKQKPNS